MPNENEKWNKFAKDIKNKRQRGGKDTDKAKTGGVGSFLVVEGCTEVGKRCNWKKHEVRANRTTGVRELPLR